ncbi:MAG: erythromycin esterase family protein [Cytophagaceae bacterium]|nr:erythromycin esterase family protein [Gemmatimonadaceae bacterium]
MIHMAHEPLHFRNQVIKYAVTRLGFTAVAIESGFTEGNIIDRYIQGGPGDIDTVLRVGFTSGFNRLPEERELVAWMREYNTGATRKVRFYGLDVPGDVGPLYSGAPLTLTQTLEYLERVAPTEGAVLRRRLEPLLARFSGARYRELSDTERRELRSAVDQLTADLRRTSVPRTGLAADEQARAVRTAWNAQQLLTSIALRTADGGEGSGNPRGRTWAAIRLRDSVMFENARWALDREGRGGKLIVFAHNGHSMNVPMVFPAMGPPMVMMGQRLRAHYGKDVFVVGTATGTYEGLGTVAHDMSLFEVALANVGLGNYAIDLRTGDSTPAVAAMLRSTWLTRIHAFMQPFVPRDVADVFVVFDKVTRSRLLDAPPAR